MPEDILRKYMGDIELPNDDTSTTLMLKRPSRAERSVDDPIREMDDMLVDEYGRYCGLDIPFTRSIHHFTVFIFLA